MDKFDLLEKHFTIRHSVFGSHLMKGNRCAYFFLHRNQVYIESMDGRKTTPIPIYCPDEAFVEMANTAFEELAS